MRNAVFRVVRVSGTMRKAEEEAIRRARREIGRTKRENNGGVLEGLFGGKDGAVGVVSQVDDDEAVFGMDIDDDDEESDDED
jgi:ribonuclease P/MRP protein subunit POP5